MGRAEPVKERVVKEGEKKGKRRKEEERWEGEEKEEEEEEKKKEKWRGVQLPWGGVE